MRRLDAARAYQSASRQRGLREQEADVFYRVNARLRSVSAEDGSGMARVLADNDRLWMTLIDQLRDPGNALPHALRASIVSVGLAVRRETASELPDLGFLIGINDQVAAGLAGR